MPAPAERWEVFAMGAKAGRDAGSNAVVAMDASGLGAPGGERDAVGLAGGERKGGAYKGRDMMSIAQVPQGLRERSGERKVVAYKGRDMMGDSHRGCRRQGRSIGRRI